MSNIEYRFIRLDTLKYAVVVFDENAVMLPGGFGVMSDELHKILRGELHWSELLAVVCQRQPRTEITATTNAISWLYEKLSVPIDVKPST